MRRSHLSLILLIAMLVILGRAPGEKRAERFPLPTEHRLDTDAERLNRKGRKKWIAEMHRAAPGTDWKAIERANGMALQEMRMRSGRDSDGWAEIGSRNQAGRMHCAGLSVSGDSLYSGSDRGGLWKADLWGNGWRPLSDNIWGGVHHSVVAAGADPEVVTIQSASQVMLYSEDMGASWRQPTGFSGTLQQAKRIERDVADPDRVYALVSIEGQATQLYRSDDAGRSYAMVKHLNNSVGDFWIDRVNGNTLYLMISKYLHRSEDHGETWTQIGSLPSFPGKVILAASEAGAPTFYAAAKISGDWELWRSVDGGASWTFRYDIDDFWETMNCSITNPNIVLFCGVEAWRSTNGGSSFTKVNGWGEYYGDPLNKLHADNPGLAVVWHQTEGEIFFPCTDGGIYRSDDAMASVTNLSLSGLGVSQYYDVLTSRHDPWRIVAGAQDQGYQRSDGAGRDAIVDFDQLISGDYGHLTSGDGSHLIVFSNYPGFTLVHHGEISPSLHYLDFPPGESYTWIPFIVADRDDLQAYYFCARKLYRCRWTGGDNVTYELVSQQNFAQAGASYSTALSISPVDPDRWIVATNNGRLWSSSNAGYSWTMSADEGPSAHYFYGTSLVHSASDPLKAWVGGSGYNGPCVYLTEDGGLSWQAAGEGQPSTLVYAMALDADGQALYAASEAGPWRLDPAADQWQYIGGSEAPLTTFWSVEAVGDLGVMRFGTYGRGIWDFDINSVTSVVESNAPAADNFGFAAWPNPFNPRTSLRFELERGGETSLVIYDLSGRRVRTLLDGPRGAGEHRLDWDGRDGDGNSCPSGVYLCRLKSEGLRDHLSITLLR